MGGGIFGAELTMGASLALVGMGIGLVGTGIAFIDSCIELANASVD
jgi:hypothetical protein